MKWKRKSTKEGCASWMEGMKRDFESKMEQKLRAIKENLSRDMEEIKNKIAEIELKSEEIK